MIKKNLPNILSVLRLVMTLVIFGAQIFPVSVLVIKIIVVLGILSDKLDGTLARRWQVVSATGKKLESVVDPLFIAASGFFLWRFLHFSAYFLLYGLSLLFLTSFFRTLIRITTKKFFYEKSQITRYASFSFYLLSLLYIFNIPYRDFILWPITLFGTFAFFNYCRLMWNFINPKCKVQNSNF